MGGSGYRRTMDVILIPGLWLDASSWEEVGDTLAGAGHTPHALTMPGVGEAEQQSSEIGMADWVAAVVDLIDSLPRPVVLVGHSGGGNVAYGAVDARSDRVQRLVLVDTIAPVDGGEIWEFPVVDGVVPFPGWDDFDAEDVADLDQGTRADAAARALSVPARVPTDPIHLTDARRRDVPVTLLAGATLARDLPELLEARPAWLAELTDRENLDVVDLGTGHWPQFSAPALLATEVLRAVER